MRTFRRGAGALILAAVCTALTGCHSAFVQATVTNGTGSTVHLFEVDYPTASFGSSELAPGAVFHYRFKVLGSGTVKLIWTDGAEHEHTVLGPELREGQEGSLSVGIRPGGQASWSLQVHPE